MAAGVETTPAAAATGTAATVTTPAAPTTPHGSVAPGGPTAAPTTDAQASAAQAADGRSPAATGTQPTRPVAADTAPAQPAGPAVTGTPTPVGPAPQAGPASGERDSRSRDGDDPAATPTAGATATDALAAASGAMPTAAPAPTSAVTPTLPPAAAPATPPTHATQLAERLAPLQKGPDGIHQLTIHLNPVDLGPIRITAEVRGGDIHVHFAGATDAARDALRAALPELRKELQGSGFGSSSLDVSHHAPGRGAPDQGGAPGRQAREHQPGARTEPAREERAERYRGSTDERAPRPGHAGLDLHV
jgi:flagellar hook-length control protein FliK